MHCIQWLRCAGTSVPLIREENEVRARIPPSERLRSGYLEKPTSEASSSATVRRVRE